jgi:hypothetical protein
MFKVFSELELGVMLGVSQGNAALSGRNAEPPSRTPSHPTVPASLCGPWLPLQPHHQSPSNAITQLHAGTVPRPATKMEARIWNKKFFAGGLPSMGFFQYRNLFPLANNIVAQRLLTH